MTDQKSLSLNSSFIPPMTTDAMSLITEADRYNQNFIVYRVKQRPIEITGKARDQIIQSLTTGATFVLLGEYLVMTNTIASIEPLPLRDKTRASIYQEMKSQFND